METNGIGLDEFVDALAGEEGAPVEDTPTLEAEAEEESEVTSSTETESDEDEDELYLLDDEEDDADDEPDEKSDEDDSDEEETDDTVHTVKVDGETLEVSTSELIKGYGLQKSLTRKGQELAEKEKSMEKEIAAVQYAKATPEIRALDEKIRVATDAIKTGVHYGTNGEPIHLTRQQIEATKVNVNEAMAERQNLAKPPRMEELMEKSPDLFSSDPDVAGKASAPYSSMLREFGYSEPEIQTTDDPRTFFMMQELLELRELRTRVDNAKAKRSKKNGIVERPTKGKNNGRPKNKPKMKGQSLSQTEAALQSGEMSPADIFADIDF